MARLTIKDLRAAKGTRKLTQLFVRTPDEARAVQEAGIELLQEGVAVRFGVRMGDDRQDMHGGFLTGRRTPRNCLCRPGP